MIANARRMVVLGLVALGAVIGGDLFAFSASALAAAPETPEVTVESITATTATFHGVLSPVEAAEPNELGGTYRFLYKASSVECEGSSVTKPSALYFGAVHEEVFKTVSGLQPNTEYAVCLSVTNLEGETTVSAPVQFATHAAPEKPETKAAADVTAVSAKLEGTLDPHSMIKVGGYFAYSEPEGSSCTEGPTVGLEGFEGEKEEEAIAVHAAVGLEPDRTYRVCLVANDEVGDAVTGNEVIVTTLAPPPVVVSESAPALVTPVSGSLEAKLTGTVNPINQETQCHFQYGTGSVSEHDVPCAEPGEILTGGEQGVAVTVTGLELGKTYRYRIVLMNAKGEEANGAEEKFETLGVPVVQTGGAENVTGTDASLGGTLDAGGEAEYYVEYGTAPCSANSCGTKSGAVHVTGDVQECTLGGMPQQCVTAIVVSGLEPSTTYHYWLVADNGAVSKPVHGAAGAFTTSVAAPVPHTGLAENVTATSARILGEVDPGGGETEYYVEYLSPSGTTARSAAAFVDGKTTASVGPVALSGLAPNTTYYYWLVAKNSAVSEPVHGEAQVLTTPLGQAEVEAQRAANSAPVEELAAAAAAKQKLRGEEEARRAQEAAAANAAKQKQYEEITAETVGLQGREAEADKQSVKAGKAKPRPMSCRKGFVKRKNNCVLKKSKKKKKKN